MSFTKPVPERDNSTTDRINNLDTITPDAIEAAREILVVGA